MFRRAVSSSDGRSPANFRAGVQYAMSAFNVAQPPLSPGVWDGRPMGDLLGSVPIPATDRFEAPEESV
jgi:hypothetical protein